MLTDSAVITWMLNAFRNREFDPADVVVILLNEKGEQVRTWKISQAIPKKWIVSDLNSTENAIVIETLELTYRYFTVE
jgi:phage tail-like protein